MLAISSSMQHLCFPSCRQVEATLPAITAWSGLPEPVVKHILQLAFRTSGRTLQQWLRMYLVCRHVYVYPAPLQSRPHARCTLAAFCTVLGLNWSLSCL